MGPLTDEVGPSVQPDRTPPDQPGPDRDVDMEDEDGTCLLDVLCDPQALNDFLHGTNEQLQTEDLLINASSGEPPLFTDAPSPVSLLGGGRGSPDTPPPGCVDLSFLEEALLSSPEGGGDPQAELPVEAGCEAKKGEVEEVEGACDILQQSLQEAQITEQTMALEADLSQPGESLSMYSPAPLLSPPTVAFIPKSVTLPVTSALPRDTQAAVEPPQPSLLAVGPGCPSLKPAAAAQLMGLLPGNVFPAPSPETSFSLSPAQGSGMILHKAVPSVTSRPLLTPTLRAAATAAAAAPGIILQRAPLPIQPKLPVSIQPRLVQISPKPSGQKPGPGLTFVPRAASSNILLSQSPGQKTVVPAPQPAQQLPKPVSLQLVNQGGSFVLQPQGLFRGQNQFLLPGQSPVTISQAASPARPLLTPSLQGPSLHGVTPSTGQLVDGPQILTVPQRQLNFSPVFTPTGQLALRQATVLSGPLQLQSAPAAVFQMPAQLAGAYTPGGQGQRATLVHSPALGNHITLINSSAVLPSDLTSISIVNGPPVVQGLPFAAQTATRQTDGPLSLQQASVVLLPEDRPGLDQTLQQLQQSYGHVVQHVAVQPSSSPPAATVQLPPEPPLTPTPAVNMPKEEMTNSMSQNQAFMQHLQQQALRSPVTSELLVEALPVVSVEALASPVAANSETPPASHAVSSQDPHRTMSDQCVEDSPLRSDTEDSLLICSPDQVQDTGRLSATSIPPSGLQMAHPESKSSVSETTTAQACIQPQFQYPVPHQLQISQALFAKLPPQIQASGSQPQLQVQVQVLGSQPQVQVQVQPSASVHSTSHMHVGILVPQQQPAPISSGGDHPAAEPPAAQQPEVQQPAVQKVQQPAVQKVQQPAVQKVQQPSIQKVQQPVVQKVQQPAIQKVQQPAVQKVQQSAVQKVQQPAIQKVQQSAIQNVQHLAVQKVQQPAIEKVQQRTLNNPAAALVVESQCCAVDAVPPSPAGPGSQLQRSPPSRECPPLQPIQHSNQLAGRLEPHRDEMLTPAERRKRFQQQLCSDRAVVQSSFTGPAFSTLKDAVRSLLPFHACAGHLPAEESVSRVDQEFDSVSGFLLKRTKDMVNKYRQLLVAEAQQESPSAEMVMLERLFLQAERNALTEDRRRARREPETSLTASASAASPRHGGPSSPPAWTRLSDRPPGLKTYRSSSRGALRLTIKQESGSRKVVHNSAHDPGLKRDHTGQLTNGGGAVSQRSPQAPSGVPQLLHYHDQVSNGNSAQESPQRGPASESKSPHPLCPPQPEDVCLRSPPTDVSAPKLKCSRWDASPGPEPPPPPLQEDSVLSEHLQSAIDSILELQRLQGPPAAPSRAPSGPSLDQAVTSILEGHL